MWRKATTAAALLIICATIVLATMVPMSGAEETEQSIETFTTEGLSDIEVSQSNPIYTGYSFDEVKGALIITGHYVDGSTAVLDSSDFSILYGSLAAGYMYISVMAGGIEKSIQIYVTSLQPSYLEVEKTGTLFQGMSESEVKTNLRVTLYYNDGSSKILNPEEYTVNGFTGSGMVEILVVHIDSNVSASTVVDVEDIRISELRYEQIHPISSGGDLNDIIQGLNVTAVYNDGSEVQNYMEYELKSPINIGKDEVKLDEGKTTIETQVVLIAEGKEFPIILDVTPTKPTSVLISGAPHSFNALETFKSDRILVFSDDGTFKYVTDYTVEYYTTDESGNQILTEDTAFDTNHTHIKVLYKENGEPVESNYYQITVSPLVAEKPSFNDYPGTFGDDPTTTMAGVDSEIMEVTITSVDGFQMIDNGDGSYVFKAANAGTYEVTVTLKSGLGDNYIWEGEDKSIRSITFSWTVNKVGIDPSLEIDDGPYHYGDLIHEHISVNGNTGNAEYTIYFYGQSNDGTINTNSSSSTELTSEYKLPAGVYYFYVVVDPSTNYQGATTIGGTHPSVTVERMVVPYPEDPVYEYTGGVLKPSFESSLYEVLSEGGTNVGPYPYTLLITDGYNYQWANGSETYNSNFQIIQAKTNSGQLTNLVGWTYGSGPSLPTATFDFSADGEPLIEYAIEGTSEFTTDIPTNAGTYIVRATVKETNNYIGGIVTDKITIERQELSYIVFANNEEYTGKEISPELIVSPSESELHHTVKSTVPGINVTDNPYVVLSLDPNYRWNEDQIGTTDESSQDLTITISILKAQKNKVVLGEMSNWTYGDEAPPLPDVISDFGKDTAVFYFKSEGSVDDSYVLWTGSHPTEVGTYILKVEIPDNENYIGGSDTTTFSIERRPISAPTVTCGFTYDGTEKTVDLSGTGFTIQSGKTAINAGTHYVIIVPDSNHQWAEGEYEESPIKGISIPWSISPRTIMISGDHYGRIHTYNGEVYYPSEFKFQDDEGKEWDVDYSVSSQSTVDVSSTPYWTTIKLTEDSAINYTLVKNSKHDYDDISDEKISDIELRIWYMIVGGQYVIDVYLNKISDESYGWIYDNSTTADRGIIVVVTTEGFTENDPDQKEILDIIHNKGYDVKYYSLVNGERNELSGMPTEVGSYSLTVTIPATDAYISAEARVDFEIKPYQINVDKINGYDGWYDGEGHLLDGNPVVNAVDPFSNNIKWLFSTDNTTWSENLSFTDVWNGTVYYKVSADNHLPGEGSFSVNIVPKVIEVTIGNSGESYGKPYDGAVPGDTELVNIPVTYDPTEVFSRDSDFEITLSFDSISANSDTYYISANDNSQNYTLSYSKIPYTISKAVLNEGMFDIEVYGGKDGTVYDGKEHDSISTYTVSIVEGNNPKWEFSTDGNTWSLEVPKVCDVSDAADYAQIIYYRFTADNYKGPAGDSFTGTVTVFILPLTVIISVGSVTVTYGNSLSEDFVPTFTGLIDGDSVSGTASFSHSYEPGLDVGRYDVVVSGYGDEGSLKGNYTVHYEPGVLNVVERQLTVAIYDYSIEWNSSLGDPQFTIIDGEIFESGVNLTDLVSHDFMTDASDPQQVSPSELGTYRIVGNVNSTYSNNYDVKFVGYLDGVGQNREYGILTIVPISAPLTVGVSDTVYTGAPVQITVTDSEGTEVDPKYLNFTYREGEKSLDEAPVDVGSYTVYVTYNDEHYSSNHASAGYVITPATYRVGTLTITDLSPEYTGELLLPNYTGSLQLVNDDYEDMHNVTPIYLDSDGNEIKPVNVKTGGYKITLIFHTENPNYQDYSTSVEFEIVPKEVSATWSLDDTIGDWSDERYYLVYDGFDHKGSVNASFIDVDGKTVQLNPKMETTSGLTEFKNAGIYTFSVNGDQGNYKITNNTQTYEITKRPVTIGVEGLEMVYATEYPALGLNYLTADGFVDSEADAQLAKVSMSWVSGFGPGSAGVLNVSVYDAVIVDCSAVSDNYDVSSSVGQLTVTPRELEVTIKDQNWAVYTGNSITVPTTYIYNPENPSDRSTIPWAISGDVYSNDYLGLEVVTGNDNNSVGPNADEYAITGTWSNTNYDVEFTSGTFTINQADLDVVVTGYSGPYDGESHDIVSVTNGRYDITVSSDAGLLLYDNFQIQFAKEGSEEFGDVIQVQHVSDSGTYLFTFSDPANNYKTFIGEFQVTINQSSNPVIQDGVGKGWTYGSFVTGDSGFTQPTFKFDDVSPTITYTKDGEPYTGNFDSGTPAGTYVMKVVMPGNGDYTETAVEYTLVVAKAPYKLNWTESAIPYDGNAKTNTLEYNDSIVAIGHSYGSDSGVQVTIDDNSVIMTATGGGTYYITATIVNGNYRWDGYDEATTTIDVRWTISTDENVWTTDVSIADWTYGGIPSTPSGEAKYGNVIFTWSTVEYGGFVPYDAATVGGYPVDAGTYYLRAVVHAGSGYGAIIETVSFSILPRYIAAPATDSGVELDYSPNGTTFDITNTDWFKGLEDEEANDFLKYVSSINTGGSDADSYTSLFYLNSPGNCVWNTGAVEGIEVSWKIVPELLDVGILGGYSYEYTGEPIHLDLSKAPEGASGWSPWFDDSKMTVTGITYATFADQYVAYLTLVDDRNYAWNLDSESSTDRIEIHWSIVAKEVEPPEFMGKDGNGDALFELTQNYDDESFAGGVPTLNLRGVDTSYMSVTTNGRLIYNDDGTISVEAPTPGEYYITITIMRNHEYAWADRQDTGVATLGNDGDVTSKTYTWIVTGKIDSTGFSGGEIEYNGELQAYIPDWFDSRIMEISGNEGRDVNNYTLTVKPAQYYTWADGTSTPMTIGWSITPMTAVVYWSQSTFTYDGTDQSSLVSAYYVDLEGKMVSLNVTTNTPWYFGDCTFTAAMPEGTSNYVISDTDSKKIYSMGVRNVHIVADDLEIEYGETPNLSWDYAGGSDLFVESDVGSIVNLSLDVKDFDGTKSEYDIVVTVTGDYEDRYNITTDKGTLAVISKQIQLPSIGAQMHTGEMISIESLLDSEYYSYSGQTEAVDVGSYRVVLSLTNQNYVWYDTGTSEDRTITWHIVAGAALDKSMFQVDVSNSVYTGSPIVKSVLSENLIVGIDYVVSYSKNIDVGTATITIAGIGSYTDQLTYEFEIVKATPVVDFANDSLEMYIKDSSFLNPVDVPSYVSGMNYASSNTDVAAVDSTTGAITMNGVGTVIITVTVPGTDNYTATEASYELTVSETPVEVVDNIVYIRVPVEPDDSDDPTDDPADEPTIVYQNDNTLYIILLLVLTAVCIGFAAYIMYTHRKQEDQGGGQR